MSTSKVIRVGWIGCGVMGLPMCCNAITVGCLKVFVYSRTPEKCAEALSLGATLCADPADIVRRHVDIVVSMVGFPSETRDLVYGSNGIIEGIKQLPEGVSAPLFVDMSTGDPFLAQEIAETFQQYNTTSLDAPVSGGDIGARNRKLSIFVGGDQKIYSRLRPILFDALADVTSGGCVKYIGSSGEGHRAKIMNQILIASNMIGVCEAILYAKTAGIPLETVLEAVQRGAAGSWSLSNLGPRILNKDFEPGFFIDHIVKDIGIALNDAQRLNLKLPGLSLAYSLYKELQNKGCGKMGTQALFKELEAMQEGVDASGPSSSTRMESV